MNDTMTQSVSYNRIPWEKSIGKRFGLMVLVGPGPVSNSGNATVLLRCDCGGQKFMSISRLFSHGSGWDHCGCLSDERRRDAARIASAANQAKQSINKGKCIEVGCDKPARTTGRCDKHYKDQLDSGQCEIDGCLKPQKACGWCAMHYHRNRNHGDPLWEPNVRAKKVDRTRSGYRTTLIDGQNFQEHRWVMSQIIGRDLLSLESVHHINGERDDNRPENLELWEKSHPSGQRVEDKVKWARELLRLYGDMFPE